MTKRFQVQRAWGRGWIVRDTRPMGVAWSASRNPQRARMTARRLNRNPVQHRRFPIG